MALRAKAPKEEDKKIHGLVWGEAGTGKTKFGIGFYRPYIVDKEHGSDFYYDEINKSHGEVFHAATFDDVLDEVRSLRTEKHDFRTLVIDPVTQIYHELLEECAERHGTDFGKHVQEAGKKMEALNRLLMLLDMNVILTAHGKTEYGDAMAKLGTTWDCWKKHIYYADLGLLLERRPGGKHVAIVKKTRIEAFPDGDVFEWSYDEFVRRYGKAIIEDQAKIAKLATAKQLAELDTLLGAVVLKDGTVKSWLRRAKVDQLSDLTTEQVAACIKVCKAKFGKANAA